MFEPLLLLACAFGILFTPASARAADRPAAIRVALEVQAAEVLKRNITVFLHQEFQGLGDVVLVPQSAGAEDGEGSFDYYVSVVALPVDKGGDIFAYALASLVLAPVPTQDIFNLVSPEIAAEMEPYLANAHQVKGWELAVVGDRPLALACRDVVRGIERTVFEPHREYLRNTIPVPSP